MSEKKTKTQEQLIRERNDSYPKDFSWMMDKTLQDYVRSCCLTEHPVMLELKKETLKLPKASMISSPLVQQLISIFLKCIGAKKTLDIGVFTGFSALNVALNLPEDGKVFAFDIDDKMPAIGKKYWKKAKVDHKIELNIGKAEDLLKKLLETEEGNIDFAFIDADKESYIVYYELCLKLLKKGGLIIVDNVLWKGTTCYEDVDTLSMSEYYKKRIPDVKKFNQMVKDDQRVDIVMLYLSDGVTVIRKK